MQQYNISALKYLLLYDTKTGREMRRTKDFGVR